jgi:hypothetical protein
MSKPPMDYAVDAVNVTEPYLLQMFKGAVAGDAALEGRIQNIQESIETTHYIDVNFSRGHDAIVNQPFLIHTAIEGIEADDSEPMHHPWTVVVHTTERSTADEISTSKGTTFNEYRESMNGETLPSEWTRTYEIKIAPRSDENLEWTQWQVQAMNIVSHEDVR